MEAQTLNGFTHWAFDDPCNPFSLVCEYSVQQLFLKVRLVSLGQPLY